MREIEKELNDLNDLLGSHTGNAGCVQDARTVMVDPDPADDPNRVLIPSPFLTGPGQSRSGFMVSGGMPATGRFGTVPLPKRLATRLAQGMNTGRPDTDAQMLLDTLQEANDIFDQVLRFTGTMIPSGVLPNIMRALYAVLDAISAVHPHEHCPYCKQQATALASNTEPDETELFHWMVNNWSESKQNLITRLKRDFTITKKEKD